MNRELPPAHAPARYFPVEAGAYRVSAGLSKLGRDFGNGTLDACVVQIDREFGRYRDNKLACRQERLGKYVLERDLSPEVERAVCLALIELLTSEHSQYFGTISRTDERIVLCCRLTGESLVFDDGRFHADASESHAHPAYRHGIDALVCQIQEDLAVISRTGSQDWVSALHLCAPGHWSAEEKIGLDFSDIHAPVPGIEPITRARESMVKGMIEKGPLVRFVWGFATDDRLNHHPLPPAGLDAARWNGRHWLTQALPNTPFYLRIERQATLGLPEVSAALFFIHVYHLDGEDILSNPTQRSLLRHAIETMDEATRHYKGLANSAEALLERLNVPH